MIRIAGPVWLRVTCDLWLYKYLQKINYTFVENVFKFSTTFSLLSLIISNKNEYDSANKRLITLQEEHSPLTGPQIDILMEKVQSELPAQCATKIFS